MAEYIQRETLLERAEYDNNYRLIIPAEAIKAAPAADVVPVVRCKDCKYRTGERSGLVRCRAFNYMPMRVDNFCSYGERMDGGAE